MIFLLFLSFILTNFQVSKSSFSDEETIFNQNNLSNFRLIPNSSPNDNDASPIFSDRTHKPDTSQANSLQSSPQETFLSPLLKKHHASLSDDNFEKEDHFIKMPQFNFKNQNLIDSDKNQIYTNSSKDIKNICPQTILGYDRNKVIIASISLTVFAGGMICLFMIKD